MQRGDNRHPQLSQERQNVTAGRPAKNAELVLQTDDIHIADIEKVRGAQIRRQVLLVNLEADHFRVVVTTFDVIDGHTEALTLGMRGSDGRKQVGGARGDAASTRQMITDESDLANFVGLLHAAFLCCLAGSKVTRAKRSAARSSSRLLCPPHPLRSGPRPLTSQIAISSSLLLSCRGGEMQRISQVLQFPVVID